MNDLSYNEKLWPFLGNSFLLYISTCTGSVPVVLVNKQGTCSKL